MEENFEIYSIRKFEKAWKDLLKITPKEEEKREREKVITRFRDFLYGGVIKQDGY